MRNMLAKQKLAEHTSEGLLNQLKVVYACLENISIDMKRGEKLNF